MTSWFRRKVKGEDGAELNQAPSQAAPSMYYDKEKKRWRNVKKDGEASSEDEPALAPPPKMGQSAPKSDAPKSETWNPGHINRAKKVQSKQAAVSSAFDPFNPLSSSTPAPKTRPKPKRPEVKKLQAAGNPFAPRELVESQAGTLPPEPHESESMDNSAAAPTMSSFEAQFAAPPSFENRFSVNQSAIDETTSADTGDSGRIGSPAIVLTKAETSDMMVTSQSVLHTTAYPMETPPAPLRDGALAQDSFMDGAAYPTSVPSVEVTQSDGITPPTANIMHTTGYPVEEIVQRVTEGRAQLEDQFAATSEHVQDAPAEQSFITPLSEREEQVAYYDADGNLVSAEEQQNQVIYDASGQGYYQGQRVIFDEAGNAFTADTDNYAAETHTYAADTAYAANTNAYAVDSAAQNQYGYDQPQDAFAAAHASNSYEENHDALATNDYGDKGAVATNDYANGGPFATNDYAYGNTPSNDFSANNDYRSSKTSMKMEAMRAVRDSPKGAVAGTGFFASPDQGYGSGGKSSESLVEDGPGVVPERRSSRGSRKMASVRESRKDSQAADAARESALAATAAKDALAAAEDAREALVAANAAKEAIEAADAAREAVIAAEAATAAIQAEKDALVAANAENEVRLVAQAEEEARMAREALSIANAEKERILAADAAKDTALESIREQLLVMERQCMTARQHEEEALERAKAVEREVILLREKNGSLENKVIEISKQLAIGYDKPEIQERSLVPVSAVGLSIEIVLTLEKASEMIDTLLSFADDEDAVLEALREIEARTFFETENRAPVIQSGGVEAIFSVLEKYVNTEDIVFYGIGAMWNLTFCNEAVERIETTNITNTLQIMDVHHNSQKIQAGCCATIMNLASTQTNRDAIVNFHGLSRLVKAIEKHADSAIVLEQACQALYMIGYHPDIKKSVLEARGLSAAEIAKNHPSQAARKWGTWLHEILA